MELMKASEEHLTEARASAGQNSWAHWSPLTLSHVEQVVWNSLAFDSCFLGPNTLWLLLCFLSAYRDIIDIGGYMVLPIFKVTIIRTKNFYNFFLIGLIFPLNIVRCTVSMLEEEEEMTVTKDKLKAQSFIRLAVAQLRTTASLRMEPEGGVFFRWWREAFYCQNSH